MQDELRRECDASQGCHLQCSAVQASGNEASAMQLQSGVAVMRSAMYNTVRPGSLGLAVLA